MWEETQMCIWMMITCFGTPNVRYTASLLRLSWSLKCPNTQTRRCNYGRHVCILVDSGSSYNFINSKQSGCILQWLIMACRYCCQATQIQLSPDDTFHGDLFALDMGPIHIVLGCEWLRSLGEMALDFNRMWDFSIKVRRYFWRAMKHLNGLSVRPESWQEASKIVCAVYALHLSKPDNTKEVLIEDEDMQELVQQYSDVFAELSHHLPPQRDIDYSIILEPGSNHGKGSGWCISISLVGGGAEINQYEMRLECQIQSSCRQRDLSLILQKRHHQSY